MKTIQFQYNCGVCPNHIGSYTENQDVIRFMLYFHGVEDV